MATTNPLYPRTITVSRMKVQQSGGAPVVGDVGFSGDDPVLGENIILSGIPANISYKGANYRNPVQAPTDARGSRYLITIPLGSAALGSITVGDIVTDDVGLRYRVAAPDFQILGYELQVELLNA